MSNLIYILFRRLRLPLIVVVIVYAISIMGFVLIPGIDDQGQPWKMSFFHAFYFVSFMGTTIGFGEIPYEFVDAQRFWALLSMYATVIAWLYCIGSVLSVFQDKIFLQQMRLNGISRKVSRLREPFYIICGYGNTGSKLASLLSNDGVRTIVIDNNEDRINELDSDDFVTPPLGLVGDASDSNVLELAGLASPWCKGIVSLGKNPEVNLTVAITAQLLNPDAKMIAKAETPEAESNIKSFGANEIINPFNTFGENLVEMITSPSLYCLQDWMTGERNAKLTEPPQFKEGKWIICGYDYFGKTINQYLEDEGIECVIVMSDKADISGEINIKGEVVYGRPTDTDTLKKAGIEDAVGIVATGTSDANNLSIVMTARELNPDAYRVVRQNDEKNSDIFSKASAKPDEKQILQIASVLDEQVIDLLMQRGSVIANRIYSLIRTPLLGDFLRIVSRFKKDKANELVSRIVGVVDDQVPVLWELSVTPEKAPALFRYVSENQLLLNSFYNHKLKNPKHSVALFLKRGDGNVLLPDESRFIKPYDRFLLCGTPKSRSDMLRLTNDYHLLENVLSNEYVPSSWFWRLISRLRSN